MKNIKQLTASFLTLALFCGAEQNCFGASDSIELAGTINNYGRIEAESEKTMALEADGSVCNWFSFISEGGNTIKLNAPFFSDKIKIKSLTSQVEDLGYALRRVELGKLNESGKTCVINYEKQTNDGNQVKAPSEINMTGKAGFSVKANLFGSKLPLTISDEVTFSGDNSGFTALVTLAKDANVTINSDKGIFGGNITARGKMIIKGTEEYTLSGTSDSAKRVWDFSGTGAGFVLNKQLTLEEHSELKL